MKFTFLRRDNHAGWLVSVVLYILVLAPLCSVLLQIVSPGLFTGNLQLNQISLLFEVFERPFWQRSLINSIFLSLSTALLGTILGTLLAIFRSNYRFPTANWLDVAVWLLFIVPSFIIAQGWVLFSADNGVAERLLHTDFVTSFFFSPFGLVFIMTISKFPLAYLSVRAALRWQMPSITHAALLSGASHLRVWMKIKLPLLRPATISGFLLVFMDTIGDFGLPSVISTLYRFPTLPYAIYSSIYTTPIRFDMAGVLSFYLVLIILCAIFLQHRFARRARYDYLSGNAIAESSHTKKHVGLLATCCNLIFLALIIGIPIGSTVFMSFVHDISNGFTLHNLTFQHYIKLFDDNSIFVDSMLRSLKIALAASTLGLIIGLLTAYVLSFSRKTNKQFIESLSLLSLAVPGVVLGIGYIFFWNQKWLDYFGLMLYGTLSLLVIASIAGAVPITTRIILGTMGSIPRAMLDAAQLQGMKLNERLYHIIIPLCKSAVISAALCAFGMSVFDLAVNSILYPTGQITLPVMISRSFESFQFGYASAATVLGGACVTTIIGVTYSLFHKKVRNN